VLVVTLVVTPVAYSLFDEAQPGRLLRRAGAWLRSKPLPPHPVTPV
jgi:hypothetical protein